MGDDEIDVSRFKSAAEFYETYRGRVPCMMMGALQRVMRERGLTFPEAWAHFRGKGAIIEIAKTVGVPEAPAMAPRTRTRSTRRP
jgi:hypothetical protein